MNTLERALIEKAGREAGWESVIESHDLALIVASARHQAQATLSSDNTEGTLSLQLSSPLIHKELLRSITGIVCEQNKIIVPSIELFARLLRRAAELEQSLPDQAARTYAVRLKEELKKVLPGSTEVERLVRQRVGQDTFREALLDYWAGSCAVTGIDLPEILRASHAKPWAYCDNDEERLDVFNGFLLSANLDALFDRGLISFDTAGRLFCSPKLAPQQISSLHLHDGLALRWLAPEHEHYLDWHRSKVYQSAKNV
ncbi:MAG: HNH endonuclease [Chlorobium sp.]